MLVTLLALLPAVLAVRIDRRQTAQTVPGAWIAVLKPGAVFSDVNNHVKSFSASSSSQGLNTRHEYDIGSFQGFAFDGDDDLLDLLSKSDAIESIRPDRISSHAGGISVTCTNGVCTTVTWGDDEQPSTQAPPRPSTKPPTPSTIRTTTAQPTSAQPTTSGAPTSSAPGTVPTGGNLVTQSNAPNWGLGRVSHKKAGETDYVYDSSAGAGTTVYIIDTGINAGHSDFEGRASMGANFVNGAPNTDDYGHGTHCAGIVGSKTYGVAKKANLIGVKVLDNQGNGQNSDIIAGIQWAVKDATSKGAVGKSVISLSLGGGRDSGLNSAVAAAVKAGVFVAVAAGNNNADAGNYSPASESTVCTVGATDDDDNKASFSNYGKLLDIWGPGVNILSTYIGSNSATTSMSGTSMATPHIAGLAAYFLALNGATAPQSLCSQMASIGNKNVIPNPAGSINVVAYNNNGA